MKPAEIYQGQQLNLICDNEWPFCDDPATVVSKHGHSITLKRAGCGHFTVKAREVQPYQKHYGATRNDLSHVFNDSGQRIN